MLVSLLQYYVVRGDWASVQKILTEASGRPDQFSISSIWASYLPQLGQIRLSRTTFQHAADQAETAKAKDAQASALLNSASTGWMVDRCFDPEQAVKDALKLDKGKTTIIAAATTMSLCNETKHAAEMATALEKRYPQDTLVQELVVPQARAWLAIKGGDPQRAVTLLERVGAHDAASFAPYMRGLAYLQLKDTRNAIAAFQEATRYKGAAYYFGSPYGLAELGLGRAYAMAGDKANAKKAYEVFFSEWKNADADLPILADAKKEYAQL